jgi:hypothetical protein
MDAVATSLRGRRLHAAPAHPTQKRALEEKSSGARIAKKALKKIFAKRAETALAKNLVAEAGRDCDLVAALGPAAAQHGSAGLGGHAAQKAVDLAPAAAIRLKGALRHRRILFSNNLVGRVRCLLRSSATRAFMHHTLRALHPHAQMHMAATIEYTEVFPHGQSLHDTHFIRLRLWRKHFSAHTENFTDSGANALSFAFLSFLSC